MKGIILGFSLAAPVGPIGILCINRSLKQGTRAGFVSGLGAATADALYGCMAAFGLAAVTGFLLQHMFWFHTAGFLFLLYMAITMFLKKPSVDDTGMTGSTAWSSFLSTLVLTISNPATILSFLALFSGLGFVAGSYFHALLMITGVFLGSAAWWLLLSYSASRFKNRISLSMLKRINVGSGILLLMMSFYSLWQLLKE